MIAIEKDNSNHYRFLLRSASGQILLRSVPFQTQREATLTAKSLNRENTCERNTDHEGKFLFNVKDREGKLIGHSERYTSEAGMENGIKNLRNRIDWLDSHGLL